MILASACIHGMSLSRADAGQFFVDDFSDGIIDDGMPVTWLPGGAPAGTRDASSGTGNGREVLARWSDAGGEHIA